MHVARAKRGKTRASKSRLVLVLLLIGRGNGARFFNQSQSVAMQNQSNCGITFDTQLKSALIQPEQCFFNDFSYVINDSHYCLLLGWCIEAD